MKKLLMLLMLMVLSSLLLAEEGMYLLNRLPMKEMKQKGLQLTEQDIYNPGQGGLSDAVVMISGGTGAFVSKDGLLITNHHVAYGALQRVSTPENNILQNGYYAETRDKELHAPGYEVTITLGFEDVTDKVMKGIKNNMAPEKISKMIEKNSRMIEKEAEKDPNVDRARVVSMFSGKYFYLFKYRVFKDVRIVYAPPHSIGKYGGEIDNWMWPRHTGDFTFFRVYARPDGTPAEYAEDNVPYHPKRWVPFSKQGVKEGDFTFIIGYPGTTMRYRSSHSVDYYQNVSYPNRIRLFKDLLELWEAEGKKDESVKIKYASLVAGISNSLKNNQGMVDGFRKLKLLKKKQEFDQGIMAFLEKHPTLKKEYGAVFKELEDIHQELAKNDLPNTLFRFTNYITRGLSGALTAYEWSLEKTKPEKDRESGYDDESMERMKKSLPIRQRSLDPRVDALTMELLLNKLAELPSESVYPPIRAIYEGKADKKAAIHEFVQKLYENTKVLDLESYQKMLDMSTDELLKTGDSFIQFAKELYPYIKESREKDRILSGRMLKINPKYVELVAIYKKYAQAEKLPDLKQLKNEVINLYPDANRTIRLTYGTVKGYSPADAVYYRYMTSFTGVLEKERDEEPFDAPDKFHTLFEQRDYGDYVDPVLNDVPVNFLHTTDITGGNSGSPVFNAKGEYIGIAFDGNYEAMTSDWQFDESITRTISVDVRYILFILDKFSNARSVLEELEIR